MTIVRDEIARCVDAEQKARECAAAAPRIEDRDRHIMLAERYADRAWSLAENEAECDPVPSTLWQ